MSEVSVGSVLKDYTTTFIHVDRSFQMMEAGVSDDQERVGLW